MNADAGQRSPLKLSASQAYTRISTNELRFRREVEEVREFDRAHAG